MSVENDIVALMHTNIFVSEIRIKCTITQPSESLYIHFELIW